MRETGCRACGVGSVILPKTGESNRTMADNNDQPVTLATLTPNEFFKVFRGKEN